MISGGVVIDKEFLGKTLKDIWTRAKLSSNYAIVSIPEDKIYSHIFPFPKTVNESQLKEAVNLAIDFQLPIKKIDSYIGWENAGDSHVINEVLISGISKNIADGYIDALNYAGIKVLALESHLASISRSIKLKLGQATLLIKKSADGATVFILKDSIIQFCRTLPILFAKEDGYLIKEAEHIKTAFESEKRTTVIDLSLEKATIRDEYLKYPEFSGTSQEMQSKWLIAMGCLIRGEIPKGQDNHISLLPVGTAEAYAYQKTTTFITLVRNMIIGVSIFFLFTFSAAYIFIFSLSQTANKKINISASPISSDVLEKEEWIKKINLITSTSEAILSTTPVWSTLVDDIKSRTIDGIVISNFSITSVSDPISITGTAKDRVTLNQFKKLLQESTYLSTVELPLTNLEQKGNIPFSISSRLKDPSMLYYK